MALIKNGVLQGSNVYGVPFKVDLIPITNKTSRPKNLLIAESITVHTTGNKKKGADALSHTKFVDTASGYVSWHFTVDDKIIFQELPINENAWHAGDGTNGKGNRTSIAIEICEHEGIDVKKAEENASKLIRFLFNNVPSLKNHDLFPHKWWSGKDCPKPILNRPGGWQDFELYVRTLEIPKVIEEETQQRFTDVNPLRWSAKAIERVFLAGLMKGTGTQTFDPTRPATREELAQVLANMLDYLEQEE